LSFWDYAAAAPYLKIDMNPGEHDGVSAHKDAVFISPHKFVGGPGTPGLLIAKRKIFNNTIPTTPGGGTVEVSFSLLFLIHPKQPMAHIHSLICLLNLLTACKPRNGCVYQKY